MPILETREEKDARVLASLLRQQEALNQQNAGSIDQFNEQSKQIQEALPAKRSGLISYQGISAQGKIKEGIGALAKVVIGGAIGSGIGAVAGGAASALGQGASAAGQAAGTAGQAASTAGQAGGAAGQAAGTAGQAAGTATQVGQAAGTTFGNISSPPTLAIEAAAPAGIADSLSSGFFGEARPAGSDSLLSSASQGAGEFLNQSGIGDVTGAAKRAFKAFREAPDDQSFLDTFREGLKKDVDASAKKSLLRPRQKTKQEKEDELFLELMEKQSRLNQTFR